MVEFIVAPDPLRLLPPLLAALPLSFASARPPPALLPLLSPILRQRVQIHSTSAVSAHENWLGLLCWDRARASRLKSIVENASFEPHPVSGEIEIGDVEQTVYKRFDSETLKARIQLPEWSLTFLYLWCVGGEEGSGWKLAELLPFDSDLLSDGTWSSSISQADESSKGRLVDEAMATAQSSSPSHHLPASKGDEDDYWAMYDQTPGHTPARQGSLAQPAAAGSEEDHYARYADVQPAMDRDDPDETTEDIVGPGVHEVAGQQSLPSSAADQPGYRPPPTYPKPLDSAHLTPPDDKDNSRYDQPIPRSPSSQTGSETVSKLEGLAERATASEVGIRQHISTSIKSMYRLARSAGISRDEFGSLLQRELETLSIFDRDD